MLVPYELVVDEINRKLAHPGDITEEALGGGRQGQELIPLWFESISSAHRPGNAAGHARRSSELPPEFCQSFVALRVVAFEEAGHEVLPSVFTAA